MMPEQTGLSYRFTQALRDFFQRAPARLEMAPEAFAAWMALAATIALLSLWPEGIVSDHHHLDKLAHAGAYGALAAIPAFFVRQALTALAIALVLVLMGGAMELAQVFLPNRWPGLFDLAANIFGVCAGLAAGRLARPIRLLSKIES